MLRQNPKVSVIIAIYKVEKYIEKCVRSLFSQTLDDIEFIFVDDGSPDKSISIIECILKEYTERINQVKFIRHNQNLGVSKSRQDGIDAATGEYIIHCDPDDWVDCNMYELLYSNAKETDADLVICDYYSVNDSKTIHICQKPPEQTSISVLECISGLNRINIHGGLCNKLIKINIVQKANFPENISWCEDLCYLLGVLDKELKIGYVNQPLYYYRTNPTSLGHTFSESALKKDINLILFLKNAAEESKDKRYSACCKTRLILTIYWRFFNADIPITDYFPQISYDYQKYIFLNKRISIYSRIFLLLSVNGLHRQAKMTMKFFSKLKRMIKRHIIGKNA